MPQSEELRELANLGQDAAQLLFEMTAMEDSGDAVDEMLQKAKELQVSFCPDSCPHKMFMK